MCRQEPDPVQAVPPQARAEPPDAHADAALARATFDSAPDGVVALARLGRILIWNQRFEALWGFPADMLARRDIDEMRRHTASMLQDPAAFLASADSVMQTRQARFYPPVALLDGRVLERHASPLGAVPGVPDAAGGVIVRWRDVTLRHHAEQRQQELSALLDLALASADMAYWDVDLVNGQVRSVNERWYSILGYRAQDLANDVEAWDALVHPDDAAAREAAWEAHMSGQAPRYEAEFRMRHKAGHWVWLQARGQAIARGPDGRATRLVGTRQDISRAKQAEQLLRELAHTDELTGIHNRRSFLDRAGAELLRARRHGHEVSLLMIDLDHFKAINDSHGHAGGDAVLRSFVQTARTVMRQSDVFGRVGGEEFAALLPHTGLEGACSIAERLLQQTRRYAAVLASGVTAGYTVSVGVAAGLAARPADTAPPADIEGLMAAADRALYRAKAQGRDCLHIAAG
jgi:diguanylate cyclase (GGDEF)-like protein/PAS domain S-box-containing protein